MLTSARLPSGLILGLGFLGSRPSDGLLLLDGLGLDLQLDRLAHQHPARFQGDVPGHLPRFAFELTGRAEGGPSTAPRIRERPLVRDIQGHRPGHATDREIADHSKGARAGLLHPSAPVRDPRVVLHIEEVRRTEMVVAVRYTRVDARGVDLELGPGVLDRVGDVDGTAEHVELAPYLRHHQMARYRSDHRVIRIEFPRSLPGDVDAGGALFHLDTSPFRSSRTRTRRAGGGSSFRTRRDSGWRTHRRSSRWYSTRAGAPG